MNRKSARYRPLGKAAASVLSATSRLLGAALPAWPGAYAVGRFIDHSVPIHTGSTQNGELRFFCPGHNPVDRAFQLYSKEPDTIDWLERVSETDVLWDIGANVGMYTLYAARKGARVCAFEPEVSNCWILNRNLDLNDLHGLVTPLNVALSDQTGLAEFALSKTTSGTAKHQGLEGDATSRSKGRTVMAFTGQDVCRLFGLPKPNFVKIDVDGHELSVVRGLDLDDPGLKSLQVELRGNGDGQAIWRILSEKGFEPETSSADLNEAGSRVTNFRFTRT